MRVLVTGGTGFVGSHTVRELISAGHGVRVLARDAEKAKRVFAGDGDAVEVVVGDVTDAASVSRSLEGAEGVVHAAAVVAVEKRRAKEVEDTNVRAVELVVGGAAERGIDSIVYVSSLGALFHPGEPLHDDSPIATAESAYARSKAQGESYVRRLQDAGAPVRTVYPPGIAGPDDPGLSEVNHTIGVFLNQLMLDTSSGFEIIDVRDLATIITSMLRPEIPPGRYVTGGDYRDWPDMIALMRELTGRRVRYLSVPGRALRTLGRVGDWIKNHVYAFDFPLSGEAMDLATQWPGSVRSPVIEKLGLDYRDSRQSYEETIRWLHRAGHLSAKHVGKLAE